ncbi:MAG: aminotransferase class I/II-fold pyridoxal phosphate-dependent enzyme [Candidatus Pseudobacter hemicellulosilyticus]|uniref:Aminotransferase n=1 Tax=Candidatus Pseudobacter hemicellulosilyticus TaxID=3121375 RepID=A0AAJ5WSG7_9BACT|nr:MAG: aminotransferase class I/II-fold pyridoxal phosphate-dependent enzyme [Pseudobacter sp.]
MQTSKRLEGIGEYYFSQKLREIDELNKQGKQIINLGIGSPDLPPHPDVIATLQEESSKPNVHGYQNYKGTPALRKAMAGWYQDWYGVTLNPDTEILPLIGSKEGIMHICMTYLDAGDKALLPNPGYPTYRSAVQLAGGECIDYELTEERSWQPDFEQLSQQVKAINAAGKGTVKLMWVNYPHMPTGQLPTEELFRQLVAFGKQHHILICHDNPYSFILNDQPASLLATEGAKEVVIELNSLSKAQNMAGWRVGMLCGDKQRIDEVLRFKSNMDSGMFLPLQLAAAKALSLNKDWYISVNDIYRARRKKVTQLLELLDCRYSNSQAGLFVWARIPDGYKDGYALSDELLYQAGVFITPGGIFGTAGNNYIRVSLCSSEARLTESIERIQQIRFKEKAS